MAPETLLLFSVFLVMVSVMGFVSTLAQAVADWLDG
jgi:hypothetical protein